MTQIFKTISILFAASFIASVASAQEIPARAGIIAAENSGALAAPKPAVDKVDIAKKLAHPIANMISVPLQYEFNRGVGLNQGGSEQTLLVQPVMPFNLGGGDTFFCASDCGGRARDECSICARSGFFRLWHCQCDPMVLLCAQYEFFLDLGCWPICGISIG